MISKKDDLSVRVFLPSGFERAFRTVECDNWNGKGVMCKRSVFPLCQKRAEFNRPGVYILYGQDLETGSMRIYVGEGDPILPRLKSHHIAKEFWTDLISFSSSDNRLTKVHIQYLESKLVALAQSAKRCEVENGTSPTLPTLPEADIAYVERFIDSILECLRVLNVTFFEVAEQSHATDRLVFQLKGKGALASGFQSDNGFTVYLGSTATKVLSNAFSSQVWGPNLRTQLLDSGVLVDSGDAMRFTQDYEFDSPSAAAVIIYGNPMNGREAWKTPEGKTLKQVQEIEIQS